MGKKSILVVFFTILFLVFTMSMASAATVNLFDWAFYVDGTTYEDILGDSMPTSGALTGEGLGTLTWSTSVAGSHTFIAFFDHEIDQAANTFFNEYGTPVNTPTANQSWEIDEPGYVFGDIYSNVLAGSLDNTNSVPSGSPDDVSWALGWDFTLLVGETATITLNLGRTSPGSGFYLEQTDPDSPETIYYSSSFTSSGTSIPDAGILLLLSTALGGLGVLELRKRLN